ncbi:flavin-containing monooxygenase [Rhizorhabdus wittichii]|uniref:flavin-containing monooxygenase n=1 Tax=Rhizorhabdus wittichii TaxID=160791 RepID=UPI0002D716F3|nr:NAD(P)/FAD-dependent oxidoreductase [Rhizorhabdus wittichii]
MSIQYTAESDAMIPNDVDVVVVGAGFGGLHMLYSLRKRGFDAIAIEAASDVGGAWYWNRYPGARCDVESVAYSFSFSPELDAEWQWSERYAAQPEIQAYLRFTSERLELRDHIRFDTHVDSARFDKESATWTVACDTGLILHARFCIMATGPISVPILPDIAGIDGFEGEIFHTARWPQHSIDFAGKRVGIIGTGSSGTQAIPEIAKRAEHLTVFLRTPNFTVPARNEPMSKERLNEWISNRSNIRAAMWRGEIAGAGDVHMPEELRLTRITAAREFTPEQRLDVLNRRWDFGGAVLQGSFQDVMTDEAVNEEVAEFVRAKIRAIVKDPVKADKLSPKGYALGTKRLCVGTDYYETYNRDNVGIVDVRATPIERLTAQGAIVDGEERPLDILILATGFDALTGALTDLELTGEGGESIRQVWENGPHTYLGMALTGFPNLFLIGGPGSPSVFSNVVMTNEYQVDFITDLLVSMRANGETRVSVSLTDQDAWTDKVNDLVKSTLMAKADSWYVGANVPGKPRAILAFMGGVSAYRAICDEVRTNGFRGFRREGADSAACSGESATAS